MLCAQMMLVRKAEKLAEGSFIIDPRACSKGLVLGQCVRMILPKTKNTNWAWHTIYMFAVFIMLELRCQTRAQPFLQIRSFLSYSNQDNVDVRAFGNFISSSEQINLFGKFTVLRRSHCKIFSIRSEGFVQFMEIFANWWIFLCFSKRLGFVCNVKSRLK